MKLAQAPLGHWVRPEAQVFEQALLLQTCVPEQTVLQLPQWLLSLATH